MGRPRTGNICVRGDYAGNPLYATIQDVQNVWMFVSGQPTARLIDIAKETHIYRSKVFQILKFLEAAGYIHRTRNREAINIIIPLVNGASHAQGRRTKKEGGGMEQLETRQRAPRLESVHKTNTPPAVAGRRRKTAKGGRHTGYRKVHPGEE